MKKVYYNMNDVYWYVGEENEFHKFDIIAIPFIYNHEKDKIKLLGNGNSSCKKYELNEANTQNCDTKTIELLNTICSTKKGKIWDVDKVIEYCLTHSIISGLKTCLILKKNVKAENYDYIVSSNQVYKITKILVKELNKQLKQDKIAKNDQKVSDLTRNF